MAKVTPEDKDSAIRYVVDTSGVISRKLNLLDRNLVFPSSVISEIRKGKLEKLIATISEEIIIYDPSEKSRTEILERAEETGDLSVLSETDIDVLAVAYELRAGIITDDYAIQNVADSLHIAYQGADLRPITRRVKWVWRCVGCGKIFEAETKTCNVCGHIPRRISVKKSGKS